MCTCLPTSPPPLPSPSPLPSSSTSPLLQSSLEVIISQNDNALGVFSLTETTIALNDDDRSSVMVTISRMGGQLEEVTVCMRVCMPPESMASQVSILLTNQYFTCSNTPALVRMCTLPSSPLPAAGVECGLHQPATAASPPQQPLCGDTRKGHLLCRSDHCLLHSGIAADQREHIHTCM